jgi:hypothetical protein
MDNNNFLKSLSKSLLDDVRKVMEAKTHTVPKTDKEKKLAALAEPKDKITHADVLKGRGVVREAEMAGVAAGSMDGDKHMCATKVFHKEWAEGSPIKTMHADPDANGLIEWYDVMFDHGIERVMTEHMKILQQESHMHSKKKKMREEAERVDEAMSASDRYQATHSETSKLLKSIGDHLSTHKKGAVAYKNHYDGKKGPNWGHVGDIDNIHSQLKDIHDRLAQRGEYAMHEEVELGEARRGRPPKNAPVGGQEEEPLALGFQLRKAASINKPVHFMSGEKKTVTDRHIEAFNDHMAARKTSTDKADFQKRAHKSHADFVKAVSEKLPQSSKDTGEIVKYRH